MNILNKTIKFEEVSGKLFKITISDAERTESVPLLMEDFQIETFKEMMSELKFEENVPFNYFKSVVSGCAKYAMRNLMLTS